MLGVALEFKDYPDTTTPYTATTMNNMQKLLVDLIYPVGTYYETSDSEFDPNVKWGGTWELDQSGTVLVSKSSASSSKFNDDVGTVIGEENHTLTNDEMPIHRHNTRYAGGSYATGGQGSGYATCAEYASVGTRNSTDHFVGENAGGNQPHNNVQPSKIVNRWHRTA